MNETRAPIPLFCQIEQVADDPERTVLPSRLHQQGQVVGGSLDTPADGASVPGPVSEPDPVMSRQDAARVLCALFLDNAERGHHVANDELVAELRRRIRAQQHNHDRQPPAGCFPPEAATETSWQSRSVWSEWP